MLGTLRDENPFVGDSAEVDQKSNFEKFLDTLQNVKDGKVLPFTMIFDDPMSSCFIQNPNHPEPDPLVKVTVYERTFEQNEDLGINDMVV
jgi:zinc finger protein